MWEVSQKQKQSVERGVEDNVSNSMCVTYNETEDTIIFCYENVLCAA